MPPERSLVRWALGAAALLCYAHEPSGKELLFARQTWDSIPASSRFFFPRAGPGAQNHTAILRALFPLGKRIQVIAPLRTRCAVQRPVGPLGPERSVYGEDRFLHRWKCRNCCKSVPPWWRAPGRPPQARRLLCNCPIIFQCHRLHHAPGIAHLALLPQARHRIRGLSRGADSPDRRAVDRPPRGDRKIAAPMQSVRCATTPESVLEQLLSG